MTYRLLVLDLDGTVMGDDQCIRPAVREAVRRAQTAGVAVTLATGRGFDAALSYAHQLDITMPLICYQGGLIQSPMDGTVLHEETFPTALAHELLGWVTARQQQPFHLSSEAHELPEMPGDFSFQVGRIEVALFLDGVMYLQGLEQDSDFYHRYFGQHVQTVADLAGSLHAEPSKAMLIAHPATGDEILPELKAAFDGRLQIVRSHPLFVEATPPGVSKGWGVALLAAHLGIPQVATIAVGDNENDLSMVQWAGLGVAMGNATPEVKAAADWIAPSVAEDGVAAVIERFILIPPDLAVRREQRLAADGHVCRFPPGLAFRRE